MTVTNSRFTNNVSSDGQGGALYVYGDIVSISNSTLSANSASQHGGAIAAVGLADLSVSNSSLSGNQADPDALGSASGGAIYMATGSLSVSDTLIDNNTATGDGGAIYLEGPSLDMVRTDISGNEGSSVLVLKGQGGAYSISRSRITGNIGAILIDDSDSTTSFTVDETTVADNTSSTGPALDAVLIQSGTSVTLVRSTFSGNTGSDMAALKFDRGDAIVSPATLTVENSTFSANTATSATAGLIMGPFSQTTVKNTTFVNNAGDTSYAQLLMPSAADTTKFFMSFSAFSSSNDHEFSMGGSAYDASEYPLALGGNHNIARRGFDSTTYSSLSWPDEVNPGLASLADNGGFTQTHAPQSATSNTVLLAAAGTRPNGDVDQRGAVNPDANADIGAVEYVGNHAPELVDDLTLALSGYTGEAILLDLNDYVIDPDGDVLSVVSVDGLPPGLSVNLSTGVISGMPELAGTFKVVVVVEDDGSPSLSGVFSALATIESPKSTSSPKGNSGGGGGGSFGWLVLAGMLSLLCRRQTRNPG